MKILGLSGSLNLVYQTSKGDKHDAAAALIIDGKIISAIEEERINRIKHTDKFPINSIKYVLDSAGCRIDEIDQICYYGLYNYQQDEFETISVQDKISELIEKIFNYKIDINKIYFVYHHLAHVVSSYYLSGFNNALVLSIDGKGDDISGLIVGADGRELKILDKLSIENSLGIYYLHVIYILGYKQFDEYKVMGLAPYGNPEEYRDLFKTFYTLLPEGKYSIDLKKVKKCYLLTPRRQSGEPFNQVHKDIAAALQESLKEIVLHVLEFYKEKYGYSNLCLSGGVAHNCSLNGEILYSNLFNDIFVQPASHDAGCALGAALYRYYELNPQKDMSKLEHVYWGTNVEDHDIVKVLEEWSVLIQFERKENIEAVAAKLISDGAVLGWVQGRSEFGPRALGNRSIVADPRPAKNKEIINEMIKKRESYRPFAPSVMAEYAKEYFDVPCDNEKFSYMTFVLKVKEDKRTLLGAVTHIDGTARVQVVPKLTNVRYWNLIEEFRKLSGVPILLNTSFNNNAEPIVDSVKDAIVCFCTTKLNYLIIGNYLVQKKQFSSETLLNFKVSIPYHNIIYQINRYSDINEIKKLFKIKNNFENGYETEISETMFLLLNDINKRESVKHQLNYLGITDNDEIHKTTKELFNLWSLRYIVLS